MAKEKELDNKPETKKEPGVVTLDNGIEIREPAEIEITKLPLVVTVPETASSAQKEYAKVLNGYAYGNKEKWAKKKDYLLKCLKALEGVEVSVPENQKLSINKSSISFSFIRDKAGNVFYAGTNPEGNK